MKTSSTVFSSDDGVLRSDDGVLASPRLARAGFDEGLGRQTTVMNTRHACGPASHGGTVKIAVSMCAGALLLVCAGSSLAAPKSSPHQLFEQIIQCKASLKEVKELNRLLDAKQIPFPESKTVDVWGGKAWDVSPAISFGGVTSGTVVLPDRDSLYLRVVAKGDVRAEIRTLARNMHVPAQTDDPDTTYLTDTPVHRTHILPSDEKGVFWVGCTYDHRSR